MTTRTRTPRRRAGTIDQIDVQARSHDAADCGTLRYVERIAPNTWLVEWIAPCDDGGTSVLRFVSRAAYDRMF